MAGYTIQSRINTAYRRVAERVSDETALHVKDQEGRVREVKINPVPVTKKAYWDFGGYEQCQYDVLLDQQPAMVWHYAHGNGLKVHGKRGMAGTLQALTELILVELNTNRPGEFQS